MDSELAINPISGKPYGLSCIDTAVLFGLEPVPIRVEICATRGPAHFRMVGLAEASVKEARVRVAGALARLGVLLDEYALTVNLAPADLKKSGTMLDLPIALGVLEATGYIPSDSLSGTLIIGELSLDGDVRGVRGVLPQLIGAAERGIIRAIVPEENEKEAGALESPNVLLAKSLDDVVKYFTGEGSLNSPTRKKFEPCQSSSIDMSAIRGQLGARRALEIACAGGHHLLMVGSPGSGKTLLARAAGGLLPNLNTEEAIEVTAIHSVAATLSRESGLVSSRPFRAPHHSVSSAGLVGGGEVPRPGELSLAHHGILFLDELPEFKRATLESLRQPLEDGTVRIARARGKAEYPAEPLLIAAMNPCPCGYFGNPKVNCRCTPSSIEKYRSRISGPMLDRFDLHVRVPPISSDVLLNNDDSEASAVIRHRIEQCRKIQESRRVEGLTQSRLNSRLGSMHLTDILKPIPAARDLIEKAARQLGMSARSITKVLRVARTIADLNGQQTINKECALEALQFRAFSNNI